MFSKNIYIYVIYMKIYIEIDVADVIQGRRNLHILAARKISSFVCNNKYKRG